VEADFAVELAAGDASLEFPWSGEEGGPQYYDLKRHPEWLDRIVEIQQAPELRDFLASINSARSRFETAKCDVWFSREMDVEDNVFGAACKFGSYVDLLFCDGGQRFSFPEHEQFAKRLTQLLRRVPEIPAAAEFMVRRCHYDCADGVQTGFYLTFYLFGYGDDEAQAKQQWAIALKLVENAIRQMPGPEA
jgi:hypothetical protein